MIEDDDNNDLAVIAELGADGEVKPRIVRYSDQQKLAPIQPTIRYGASGDMRPRARNAYVWHRDLLKKSRL